MHSDKKKLVNELTEGMQRLCAVANRIVVAQGEADRIETDLLLDNLRRLYDVALRLTDDALPEPRPATPTDEESAPASGDQLMMAMMSTMAAMPSAPVTEPEPVAEPAPKARKSVRKAVAMTPVPEPEPAPEPPVPEPEPVPEPPASAPEPVSEPPAPEPEPAPALAPMPAMEELEHNDNALLFDEVVIEPEQPATPTAPTEPEVPAEPETPAEEPSPAPEPVAPAAEPEPPAAPKNVQASLLDYLQHPQQRTLGEQLAAQHPLQHPLDRKVDDLRTVININDRFSFMSELFHNNIKAYNDFILSLNAAATRDEALAMTAEMAAMQKWDAESATVKTFYKMLDKKF